MYKISLSLLLLLACFTGIYKAGSQSLTITDNASVNTFPLVTAQAAGVIYTDSHDAPVVNIAATALQKDIQAVTGRKPDYRQTTLLPETGAIIIGTIGQSALINQLVNDKSIDISTITGRWEAYTLQVIERKTGSKTIRILVIAGSDRRGTAFGVFDLSRKLGVSPYCWWADVTPAPRKQLYISGSYTSASPSVQYRGIFLNDEDWGLQPWAAKHMDTAVKDIGPRTYERIFELLLRLKGNYIWPAMHPCTKAFYYYPENPVLADRYAIVVGGSHCEPMLRNNVFEWNENFENEYGHKPGEWRYDLNKKEIYPYWKDRIAQSAHYENMYTVGMRGIHDGSMPGPKDPDAKLRLLDTIISDQRVLLAEGLHKSPAAVPQIFCPYKEVLTLYQRGLKLPDDVTIVWADDNHGYIRQLSSPAEQQRSGGSGVYYHLSYWGAPHDYLWLSTISPSLISFELSKAWEYDARKVWIINVGDIKPAEMETQFAFDLAWDVHNWSPSKANTYARQWAAETFGGEYADAIAQIKNSYYELAAAGKPEHTGSISYTEAQCNTRLAIYRKIADRAAALALQIPARLQDAYFELVYYSVRGACLMNEKILLAARSRLYSNSNEALAARYADSAAAAFEQIKELTVRYNTITANGKWEDIMSWQPRNLPVFYLPPTSKHTDTTKAGRSFSNIDTAAPLQVISATAWTQKQNSTAAAIETISGLGYTGTGVTSLPVTAPACNISDYTKAAVVTYSITVPEGERTIQVRTLPTHRPHTGRGVRYAIAVDGGQPREVELETPTDNDIWKQNVLKGYAAGNTRHTLSAGKHDISIYLLDPGVVLNDIYIY